MLNTNNITNAINVFKKRNVPSTGFNKSYVGYWNSRSTAINSIHLRGGSESIIREAQDNVFLTVRKRETITSESEDDDSRYTGETNSMGSDAEDFNIENHLHEGQTQYQLVSGSPLLNLDYERIKGLADMGLLEEMKKDRTESF